MQNFEGQLFSPFTCLVPQLPSSSMLIYKGIDIFFFFNFFNLYLFLRERETETETQREKQSMSRGGAEREGDQNPKQAPGSELSAQSPTRGLNSQAMRS